LSHSQLVNTRRRKNRAKKDLAVAARQAKKLENIKLHGVKEKAPKPPKAPKLPKAPKEPKVVDAPKAPKPPKAAKAL
jgi:hypothetical protein